MGNFEDAIHVEMSAMLRQAVNHEFSEMLLPPLKVLVEVQTAGTKRKSKRGDFEIEELGECKLTPEQTAKADQAIAAADEEDEACRVNFRWGRDQMDRVRAVAAFMGISVNDYIKHSVFQAVLVDKQNMHRLTLAEWSTEESEND